MRDVDPNGRGTPCLVATALTLACLSLPTSVARSQAPADPNEDCFMCHEYMEGEELAFPDGSSVPLLVDRAAWEASVHGGELNCTDCHRDIIDYPHPERFYPDARAYELALAETCNRCHYAYYTRVLDSIHFEQLESGVREAPTCTDCHGAHDIVDPSRPRIAISRRCAQCHEAVATVYEQSVHGLGLITEDNQDVPVCTDCHGHHRLAHRTVVWDRTTRALLSSNNAAAELASPVLPAADIDVLAGTWVRVGPPGQPPARVSITIQDGRHVQAAWESSQPAATPQVLTLRAVPQVD